MLDKHSGLQSYLREQGYSVTRQRLLVFDLLVGKEPMSMGQIISGLSEKIDRASIYRTIDLFEKLGIVQRLNIGWKYKIELTDKFAEHHHHLTCQKCGRILPINEEALEDFIGQLAKQNNFTAQKHQIEIQGLCEDCSSSRSRIKAAVQLKA